MYKLFSTLLVVVCLNLSACATTLLSEALPNETTKTEKIILAKDQIIALGQAVQNQQEQGIIFVGKDYNYLMTEGSAELSKLLHAIPADQRSLTNPSPLVLTMDDPNHFHGELQFLYKTPLFSLSEQQKENLKNLGFKNHFVVIEIKKMFYILTLFLALKDKYIKLQTYKKFNKPFPFLILSPYSKNMK